MKNFLFLIVAILLYAPVFSQSTSLTVIFNLNDAHGNVYVRLLDDKGKTVEEKIIEAAHLTETITFKSVLLGSEYAIESFHDMNGNKELDTYVMGVPKEPYGFSNNVRGSLLGAPELKEKLVLITKPTTIRINVE